MAALIPELEAKLASKPTAFGRIQVLQNWRAALDDAVIDSLGGQAVVVPYVENLYDRYIKGLDLPGVPNLVEPMVDEAIKKLIVALIWAVDND